MPENDPQTFFALCFGRSFWVEDAYPEERRQYRTRDYRGMVVGEYPTQAQALDAAIVAAQRNGRRELKRRHPR